MWVCVPTRKKHLSVHLFVHVIIHLDTVKTEYLSCSEREKVRTEIVAVCIISFVSILCLPLIENSLLINKF